LWGSAPRPSKNENKNARMSAKVMCPECLDKNAHICVKVICVECLDTRRKWHGSIAAARLYSAKFCACPMINVLVHQVTQSLQYDYKLVYLCLRTVTFEKQEQKRSHVIAGACLVWFFSQKMLAWLWSDSVTFKKQKQKCSNLEEGHVRRVSRHSTHVTSLDFACWAVLC